MLIDLPIRQPVRQDITNSVTQMDLPSTTNRLCLEQTLTLEDDEGKLLGFIATRPITVHVVDYV